MKLFKKVIFHKLFENFILLYGAHIARYLFPIILVPFLARVLGAESWGEVLFAQSYALYTALIIEFGFGLSGTKEVSKNRDSKKIVSKVFSNAFSVQLLLALAVVIVSILLAGKIPIFSKNANLFYCSVAMGVFQGLNTLWFFRGLEKMRVVACLDIMTKTIATVAIFSVVRNSDDGWLVLASYACANFLAMLCGLLIIIITAGIIKPRSADIFNTFKKSLTLFWVRAGASLFTEGNILIVGLFLAPVKVAYFGSAIKIITSIRSLLNPAIDVLFPRITFLITSNLEKNISFIRKAFGGISLMGLLLSVCTFLGSEIIVEILLGDEYEESFILLKLLSPLPFVISISHVLGSQWMVPLDRESVFSLIIMVGGCLNLSISLLLMRLNLSYYSVAINIVGINTLIFLTFYLYLHRTNLSPFQKKIKFSAN